MVLPFPSSVRVLLLLTLLAANPAPSQQSSPDKPTASDAVEAHLGKGYDALKLDKYEVAAAEFRAALDSDPKLTLRARFPLAVALFEMHKSDEARREFEAVRSEIGDHPNVLYYLGRLDLEDRNFEAAIQHLSQAVIKPPFSDTAYFLGYAYFKQGDLTASEKWLNEAAHTNPRDARIPYQLASVYRKQGREEDATKALARSEQLRQRDNNESKLRLECGQKLDQGPKEEARALCEQLYDPDDADKLTELGALYGQHGDLEAALKPLRRAAELAPQSPQVQYNLALAHFQLNQFEEARAPLADTLKRWPDLFQLNALYGAVLMKMGEEGPAYQALHHAHQLNPQDAETLALLYTAAFAMAQKSQGNTQYLDALRYLEEASTLRPSEAEPHERMAEIYTLMGRAAQAAAEKKEADRLTRSPGGL